MTDPSHTLRTTTTPTGVTQAWPPLKKPQLFTEAQGIFADTFLLPTEDATTFHQLREQLTSDMSAEGVYELSLVEMITTVMYRIRRVDEEEKITQLSTISPSDVRKAEIEAADKHTYSKTRVIMDDEMEAHPITSTGFWELRDTCPITWGNYCAWINSPDTWLDALDQDKWLNAYSNMLKEKVPEKPLPPELQARLNAAAAAARDVPTMTSEQLAAAMEAMTEADALKPEQPKIYITATSALEVEAIKIANDIISDDGGLLKDLEEMLKLYPQGYTKEDEQHDMLSIKHKGMAGLAYHKVDPRGRLQRRREALSDLMAKTTKELRAAQAHRLKLRK